MNSYTIGVVGIVAYFIFMMVAITQDTPQDIKVKAGLEECAIPTGKTIWVKNCSQTLDTYYKHEVK